MHLLRAVDVARLRRHLLLERVAYEGFVRRRDQDGSTIAWADVLERDDHREVRDSPVNMVPAVAALAKVLVVVRVLVLVDRRAPPRREDVAVLVEAGTA